MFQVLMYIIHDLVFFLERRIAKILMSQGIIIFFSLLIYIFYINSAWHGYLLIDRIATTTVNIFEIPISHIICLLYTQLIAKQSTKHSRARVF